MKKDFDFIRQFEDSLLSFGWLPEIPLCLGVSGGADSVSLLKACCEVAQKNGIRKIFVLTVDHRIRPEKESYGDALFVEQLCNSLSNQDFTAECSILRLEEGQVQTLADKRAKGTEDAARVLRYEAFNDFALACAAKTSSNAVFFALAHNADDQTETLLMRFLQGAGSTRTGIPETRKISGEVSVTFIRPLLEISRYRIEEYLKASNLTWRKDNTNFENVYLRNKIRNRLVPLLEEIAPGFQKALVHGREKALMDNQALQALCDNYSWQSEGKDCVYMERKVFFACQKAVRLRLLYRALGCLGYEDRFEFETLKQVLENDGNTAITKNAVEFVCDGDYLFVKKMQKKATISGFFAIIKKEGEYYFEAGKLKVSRSDKSGLCSLCFVTNDGQEHFLFDIRIPFTFKNRRNWDCVELNGKCRTCADVFDSLDIKGGLRNAVPLVEELQTGKIVVWGEIYGYKNVTGSVTNSDFSDD